MHFVLTCMLFRCGKLSSAFEVAQHLASKGWHSAREDVWSLTAWQRWPHTKERTKPYLPLVAWARHVVCGCQGGGPDARDERANPFPQRAAGTGSAAWVECSQPYRLPGLSRKRQQLLYLLATARMRWPEWKLLGTSCGMPLEQAACLRGAFVLLCLACILEHAQRLPVQLKPEH